MKKESYDKKDWAITINNAIAQEPTDYYHPYCTHCKKVLLPKASEEFKEGLGGNPDAVSWSQIGLCWMLFAIEQGSSCRSQF